MDSDSDSSSSSYEYGPSRGRQAHQHKSAKDFTISLIRDPSHKNLAEPRTSQGVFGPNGQLICFFRSFPRIVKYAQDNKPVSLLRSSLNQGETEPSTPPEAQAEAAAQDEERPPVLYESAVMPGDAVKRLMMASVDRIHGMSAEKEKEKGEEEVNKMLRILNSFLSVPSESTGSAQASPKKIEVSTDIQKHQQRKESSSSVLLSPASERAQANHSFLSRTQNTVYLKDVAFVVGAQYALACRYVYVFPVDERGVDLMGWCEMNKDVAIVCGRVDHARVWSLLGVVARSASFAMGRGEGMGQNLLRKLYNSILATRDIPLLAMISVLILSLLPISPSHFLYSNDQTQLIHQASITSLSSHTTSVASYRSAVSNITQHTIQTPSQVSTTSRVSTSPTDYFSRRRTMSVTSPPHTHHPQAQGLTRLPTSPISPISAFPPAHPLSPLAIANTNSNSSSLGSWSSLFTSGANAVGAGIGGGARGVVRSFVGAAGNVVSSAAATGAGIGGDGPGLQPQASQIQGRSSGNASVSASGTHTPTTRPNSTLNLSAIPIPVSASSSNVAGLPVTTAAGSDELSTLRQLLSTIHAANTGSPGSSVIKGGLAASDVAPIPVPGASASRSRSRKQSLLGPSAQPQASTMGPARSDSLNTSSTATFTTAIASTGPGRVVVSFSPPGNLPVGGPMLVPGAVTSSRKPTFSQVVAHGGRNEGGGVKSKSLSSGERKGKIEAGGGRRRKVLVLEGFGEDETENVVSGSGKKGCERSGSIFPLAMVPNLVAHVIAYADMLDSWRLAVQRAELLKCLRPEIVQVYIKTDGHVFADISRDRLELVGFCPRCSRPLQMPSEDCPYCVLVTGGSAGVGTGKRVKSKCAVCHLFVKGLSHTCLRCTHTTHLSCWTAYTRARTQPQAWNIDPTDPPFTIKALCPTGCGCDCMNPSSEVDIFQNQPSVWKNDIFLEM